MKLIRRIWLAVFLLVVLAYGAGQFMDSMKVVDGGPQISGQDVPIRVSVKDGHDKLIQGLTAQDGKDGDVTESIMVEQMSAMYGDCQRQVTVVAFDSDGNVTKASREIQYTDYERPVFTMNHALRWRTGDQLKLAELIHAEDCIDGDITGQVRVQTDSTVTTKTAGVYPVRFSVSNSAGDEVCLETKLEIYTPQRSEATVELSEYMIYGAADPVTYRSYVTGVVAQGVRYDFEREAVSARGSDGSVIARNSILVDSHVDPTVPGVYPVYLTFQRDECEGTTVLMVVVE